MFEKDYVDTCLHKENRTDRNRYRGYMIYKAHSRTPTPTNPRDNQIAKRKCMNITNRKQNKMAPYDPSYSTKQVMDSSNTSEKEDLNTNSQLMVLIECFMNYIYISLKRA